MDRLPEVRLRALEPEDIPLLYDWENLPESGEYGTATAPFSLQQLTDYVMGYDGDIFAARQLRLMVVSTDTGEAVGCVDLFDFDPVNSRSEIGIIISPPQRSKGFGEAALCALATYCSRTLSLHQLYATVSAENLPSRRLFERCGFSISGRLRSWIKRAGRFSDAYFYQKFL